MLDINNSVFYNDASQMVDLVKTLTKVEEGQCLQYKMEDGIAKVELADGTSDKDIAGFALSDVADIDELPFVEEITVPASAPFTVTLAKTPKGAVGIRQMVTAGTQFTTGTLATGKYSISGKVLTFHSSDANKELRVVGVYTPTLTEARAYYGEAYYENQSGSTKRTGLVTGAEILWTSNYDKTSNWWADRPGNVYSGTDGTISLASTGSKIDGVTVVAVPTTSNALLGIRVRI